MITHFILWDIKLFRVAWTGLILLVIAILAIWGRSELAFGALVYLTFIFSFISIQNIFGSRFRSQHIMSRNYLLSLPIKRGTMFYFNLLRHQFFLLPGIALLYSYPIFSSNPEMFNVFVNRTLGLHYLLIPVLSVWLSCFGIMSCLSMEDNSSYLDFKQRTFRWVFHGGVSILELIVMITLSVIPTSYTRISRLEVCLCFLGFTLITTVRLILTKRKWTGG